LTSFDTFLSLAIRGIALFLKPKSFITYDRVAFGGIFLASLPYSPHAQLGGTVSLHLDPIDIC